MIRTIVLAAIVLTLAPVPSSTSAQRTVDKVYSAGDFTDSVGVNIHLGHQATGYYDDFPKVRHWLKALGVRHVRDNLVSQSELYSPEQIPTRWQKLSEDGVQTTVIANMKLPPAETVRRAMLAPEAIESIEAPNEADLQFGPGWPSALRSFVHQLRREMDKKRLLVPLLGPSMGRPAHHAAVGDLSSAIDYANMHSYPGGRAPLFDFDKHRRGAWTSAPGLPVVATETGYHRAVKTSDGHLPASEEAVARYLPRLLLEYFREGVKRTYIYQLVDEFEDPSLKDREAHFGLLDARFQPKPSFFSVRNLLAILEDRQESNLEPPTGIRINANDEVDAMTLRKSDGRIYLCFWQIGESFDQATRRVRTLDPSSVRVRFDDKRNLALYRPTASAAPSRVWVGETSAVFPVNGDVTILEVMP